MYVINEKRGGSVHLRGIVLDIGGAWTVRREEGKYICVCCRHTWLERYIDRCVPERRSQGLHTPRVDDLKRNNERARWRGR